MQPADKATKTEAEQAEAEASSGAQPADSSQIESLFAEFLDEVPFDPVPGSEDALAEGANGAQSSEYQDDRKSAAEPGDEAMEAAPPERHRGEEAAANVEVPSCVNNLSGATQAAAETKPAITCAEDDGASSATTVVGKVAPGDVLRDPCASSVGGGGASDSRRSPGSPSTQPQSSAVPVDAPPSSGSQHQSESKEAAAVEVVASDSDLEYLPMLPSDDEASQQESAGGEFDDDDLEAALGESPGDDDGVEEAATDISPNKKLQKACFGSPPARSDHSDFGSPCHPSRVIAPLSHSSRVGEFPKRDIRAEPTSWI